MGCNAPLRLREINRETWRAESKVVLNCTEINTGFAGKRQASMSVRRRSQIGQG